MGAPAEKVVLRRYLEEALAQVRALQAKQRRESTFGSVRQLAAHIRELADAELARGAEVCRSAPRCAEVRQPRCAEVSRGSSHLAARDDRAEGARGVGGGDALGERGHALLVLA